jgi:hypothetical protein
MTASASLSTTRIDFPNLEISQAITPLLAVEQQINLAETDWLAKAELLPQGVKRDQRKSQIRAFLNELRADVNEMLRLKKDLVHIAAGINEKIEKFEASWQTVQTHNAEYARDKQKVHEANIALSNALWHMNVELVPFSPIREKIANNQMDKKDLPRHQMAKIVFDQIAKAEESWLNKGKSFDGEKKDCLHQHVRFQVLQMQEAAKWGLEANLPLPNILHPIERLQKVFDKAFVYGYQRDTLKNAYTQINKIEQEHLKRIEHLPPNEKVERRAQIDSFIGEMNQEVTNLLLSNPDKIERYVQDVVETNDMVLPKDSQHNSREESFLERFGEVLMLGDSSW